MSSTSSQAEQLLSKISWRGDEHVLDVGCGRGLLLIGAAKRLTTGKATGIDSWRKEGSPEATMENARREGVSDRVDVKTGDMRKMPFPDSSFDVIVSRAAIHNLDSEEDRAAAVREIARVLKPSGLALIDDIRHFRQYAAVFTENGCDVRRINSPAAAMVWTILTFGSLRPATLLVRK
jgi:ubiquinone/menaquinone biosynthesis C-methylase UbiE